MNAYSMSLIIHLTWTIALSIVAVRGVSREIKVLRGDILERANDYIHDRQTRSVHSNSSIKREVRHQLGPPCLVAESLQETRINEKPVWIVDYPRMKC
jgi:hypothetical protein